MKETKEGNRRITIPSRSFITCFGCEFYKSRLIKSGRYPERSHNCIHESQMPLTETMMTFTSNIKNIENGYPVTPEWCPLKTNTHEAK